jgi:hypothetical protein
MDRNADTHHYSPGETFVIAVDVEISLFYRYE